MSQKFRNLDLPSSLKDIPKENKIAAKKQINKQRSEIRQNVKSSTCLYCGKPVDSFCNSHSVPAFCLHAIQFFAKDKNGKILNPNHVLQIPIVDDDAGVRNTGTFQIICRECDSRLFQSYEDEKFLDVSPTSQMLNSIALKNYLARIYSTRFSKANFERIMETALKSNYLCELSAQQKFAAQLPNVMYCAEKANSSQRDLEDYLREFKIAKRATERQWEEYHLFYYQKLEYTVPIAFQLCFPLVLDLQDNFINNIYDYSPRAKQKDLHLCIFPMRGHSTILAFTHRKDSPSYREFFRQLKSLSLADQLSLILYIVLLYSEDVFFSKALPQSVFDTPSLIKAIQQNSDILSDTLDFNLLEFLKTGYSLQNHQNIPKLLSEEYSMERLNQGN